jgi:hypothetical protein
MPSMSGTDCTDGSVFGPRRTTRSCASNELPRCSLRSLPTLAAKALMPEGWMRGVVL